jgi:hypothetical protein
VQDVLRTGPLSWHSLGRGGKKPLLFRQHC